MMSLHRRLDDLEARARKRRPPEPVDPDQVAAALAESWSAIDRGEFGGTEYHKRALVTLRDAVESTERER